MLAELAAGVEAVAGDDLAERRKRVCQVRAAG
jgi:hypothetical protein